MCIVKFLSYCYNNFKQKRENIDHININSFINVNNKEDRWINFKKIEGNCMNCSKYSILLAIIDKIDGLNGNICYKCYQNHKKMN
jgi:hypothetical protein